jgi:translation initiation factor 2 alpha subunit (eIF-2alpha)
MKYYKSSLPELNSIVSIRIEKYEEYGVEATLVEYDLKGMIFSKELARKRIKSFKDVVRIGEDLAADVIEVDEATGNISLSIKAVSDEEREAAAKTCAEHRLVNDVLVRVAQEVGCEVRHLYETLVWPNEEQGKSVYELLVSCNDPDVNPADVLVGVAVDHLEAFVKHIKARIPKPTFKEVRDVRLVCLDCLRAPEKLSAALDAAVATGVAVFVVGPPDYKFVATDINEARAKARMEVAVAAALVCI